MIHGFDLNNPLICEGVIGDGCGGGRLFMVEDATLRAYDPQTKESMVLLEDIEMARDISKSGCIVTIVCENDTIKFDLSTIKIVDNIGN